MHYNSFKSIKLNHDKILTYISFHMPAKPLKILVVRNDKLGDFMLAWPAFALLKNQYPQSEITALVPEYTASIAERCASIDKVLIDSKSTSFIEDIRNLSTNIKQHQYDVSISLFSEARTSIALWLAGIRTRVGPATKLAQLFLNKRLRQKRSQSLKPEYEYNLDLIRYFIELNGDTCSARHAPPYLKFDREEIRNLKNKYLKLYSIPETAKIIIIHPGTGGSAINLSLQQYAELAENISVAIDSFFIITAGPGETAIAEQLSGLLPGVRHGIHRSTEGLLDFCKFICTSDLFISGSTGPLHIAGALNVKTAAFYPSRRSATAVRWQTLNDKKYRIAFSAAQDDMAAIDIPQAASNILQLLRESSTL